METTTRDQAAVSAIQDILRREDYQPELLKDMAKALAKAKNTLPPPEAVIVRNKVYSLKTIEERLAQFVHYLPPENRPEITDTSFYDENFLNQLISIIDEVSGLAPPPEAKASMDAVVPANLQELLEAQAKVTAEKKQALGRPSQLEAQIKQAQEISIRAQLLRAAVTRRLHLTLLESSYIRNLQTIYGKEAVNQLLSTRIDLAVNQSITALALNQLGVSDPSHAAGYFAAQLEKNIKADRNLAVALAKTHKADRKNALTDAKNLAEETAKEVQPAARAFRAEQDSSPIYRANSQEIAQDKVEAVLAKSGRSLTNKQAGRLAETLAKYHNQPDKQLRILKRILPGASSEVGQKLIADLGPAISALAKSSGRPSISETINENSLINLARTNPALFPFRLKLAILNNRLSDGETTALTIRLSQQLGVSPDYVAMRLAGITAKNLAAHLNDLAKGQPVFGLPTQPPLKPDSPVFRRLNDASPELNRLDAFQEEFQSNQISSSLNLQSNWRSITRFFDVGKAIRFNLGRLPPVNRMVSSAQTVFSGLRVQSEAANSMFNFFSWAGRGIRAVPSVITAPFRAVGGAITNTIINPVKTWAGTQVKAGLAKAGAWLAKKGITAAATKLGLMAVGKGAAVLLAQAVPVAGQIFAAALIGGDILKFLWDHKKEIGIGLGGMFFLGQMLLAKVLGFLGSAAWTLGGALAGGIAGFIGFGPVGAFIGGIAGGITGYLIGSGTLGSALAGIGSWLGSAAAGLGSFLGSLTSPALVSGLGTTVAMVGISGVAAGWAINTFFLQPSINSALYVQPGPGEYGGGPFPPGCPAQIWPVVLGQGQEYYISQGPGGWATHGPSLPDQEPNCPTNSDPERRCPYAEAIDISHPTGEVTPDNVIIASHPGTVIKSAVDANGGNYVQIQDNCGADFISAYVHMSVVSVVEGQPINTGDRIGIMGSTGRSFSPHLHYEFKNPNGSFKTRQDPPPFMIQPYIPKTVPDSCVGNCNISIP